MQTLGAPSQPEWQSLVIDLLGGVLTVAGRLRRTGVPLLHHDSLLAKLWLQHIHTDLLRHAGGAGTLKAESRAKFWVWKGTKLYKDITSSCHQCTKKGSHKNPTDDGPPAILSVQLYSTHSFRQHRHRPRWTLVDRARERTQGNGSTQETEILVGHMLPDLPGNSLWSSVMDTIHKTYSWHSRGSQPGGGSPSL